jgi:hypothetical protein
VVNTKADVSTSGGGCQNQMTGGYSNDRGIVSTSADFPVVVAGHPPGTFIGLGLNVRKKEHRKEMKYTSS